MYICVSVCVCVCVKRGGEGLGCFALLISGVLAWYSVSKPGMVLPRAPGMNPAIVIGVTFLLPSPFSASCSFFFHPNRQRQRTEDDKRVAADKKRERETGDERFPHCPSVLSMDSILDLLLFLAIFPCFRRGEREREGEKKKEKQR